MTRSELAAVALGHLTEITAYCRRLAGNAPDGDDLVQTVFERAFTSLGDLREEQLCRVWLFRIARNAHIDRARAVAARPELRLVEPEDVVSAEPAVFPEVARRIEVLDLEHALSKIPAEQAESVLLSDLWGFEYAEIAEITGAPLGTVRSRIARGRAQLAALLDAAPRREKGRPA